MEEYILIPHELARNFPFLYQTIKLNKESKQDIKDTSRKESSISAVQNTKAELINFYKCISRF